MPTKRKKGKWRKCPTCQAEIYHQCRSCVAKAAAKTRKLKCYVCAGIFPKLHYQRLCQRCFLNPANAAIVAETRAERYGRFRADQWTDEPTEEELEATIAAMLPTIPDKIRNWWEQSKLLPVGDKRETYAKKARQRRVTRWGNEDVLASLIISGEGGFTRAMVLADRWLQKLSKKKGKPLAARSFDSGNVVEITVNYVAGGVQVERFESKHCRNAEISNRTRATSGKDHPAYKTLRLKTR